jgi:hypothetical protein
MRPAAQLMCIILAAIVTGCGGLGPMPTPAAFAVPASFVFVRDTAGLLPPGQVRQTEELLRSIASSSGVCGVVVPAEAVDDAAAVADRIVEEVATFGGEAAVGLCTPEDCALQGGVVSPGLREANSMVAPAPEPAPGQGLPQGSRGLRAWLEFVGALATWTSGDN